MDLEERVVELEIKVAFQEERLAALSSALVEKDRLLREIERELAAVREAMKRLHQKLPETNEEVIGKYDVDDPVPRAG